jgi:hypothetical protein
MAKKYKLEFYFATLTKSIMQPLKKEDIQQSIDLYDQYAHNKLRTS